MKEVEVGKHKVVLYNSIDELPIVRFHRYNKMLLVDAGVGSDIAQFDSHIERAIRFFRNDDKDNGAKELDNLRNCVFQIMQEQNIKDLSFACLVKSIDGKPCDDISEDGLKETLRILGSASRKETTEALNSVKKKIDDELMAYFPDIFDDTSTKEFYGILKQRTIAKLQGIIDGELDKQKDEIERLTEQMILFSKPKIFSGTKSVEIQHDKNFENICLLIQKETTAEVKRMTVLEFYNAYEFLRDSAKERKKAASKRK